MCWGVEIVWWGEFQPIALVVDPTLITHCMFVHGWAFVLVWCRTSWVFVFIVSSSNRNIFIGFDVMNILAKNVELDLPRIFSWHYHYFLTTNAHFTKSLSLDLIFYLTNHATDGQIIIEHSPTQWPWPNWMMSARNFYGFKFQLLTKSQFPQSLIFLVIKAPHLLFLLFPFFTHTRDKINQMDSGSNQ